MVSAAPRNSTKANDRDTQTTASVLSEPLIILTAEERADLTATAQNARQKAKREWATALLLGSETGKTVEDIAKAINISAVETIILWINAHRTDRGLLPLPNPSSVTDLIKKRVSPLVFQTIPY